MQPDLLPLASPSRWSRAGRPTRSRTIVFPSLVALPGLVRLLVAGVAGVQLLQEVSRRLVALHLRPIQPPLLQAQLEKGIFGMLIGWYV